MLYSTWHKKCTWTEKLSVSKAEPVQGVQLSAAASERLHVIGNLLVTAWQYLMIAPACEFENTQKASLNSGCQWEKTKI